MNNHVCPWDVFISSHDLFTNGCFGAIHDVPNVLDYPNKVDRIDRRCYDFQVYICEGCS